MDKNTVYGLVLMALVFFGFMWLNTPDQNSYQEQLQQAQQEAAQNDQQKETTAVIFTDTEKEWLAKNILSNGIPVSSEDGSSAVALSADGVNLTLKGDSIYGTVDVNGKTIAWNDISANDLSKMTQAELSAAIDKVRNLSNSIGRYGRFATFLNGENKDLTLENEAVKLTLSSRGGGITRAELRNTTPNMTPMKLKKSKRKS